MARLRFLDVIFRFRGPCVAVRTYAIVPILWSNRRSSDSATSYAHCRGRGARAIVKPLVVVIDDDESIRESLPDLLTEFGFAVLTFSSAEDFLKSDSMGRADCLLLDVAMPGMTGPDLQDELKRRGDKTSIIFISALRDESIRRRVLQQGAVDILVKPFNDTALQRALSKAMGEAS